MGPYEKRLRKIVEDLGGLYMKFTSPGRANVPDRLCLLPNRVVYFIEVKEEGDKLRAGQIREIKRYRHLGHRAYVLSKEEELQVLYTLMKRDIENANL